MYIFSINVESKSFGNNYRPYWWCCEEGPCKKYYIPMCMHTAFGEYGRSKRGFSIVVSRDQLSLRFSLANSETLCMAMWKLMYCIAIYYNISRFGFQFSKYWHKWRISENFFLTSLFELQDCIFPGFFEQLNNTLQFIHYFPFWPKFSFKSQFK